MVFIFIILIMIISWSHGLYFFFHWCLTTSRAAVPKNGNCLGYKSIKILSGTAPVLYVLPLIVRIHGGGGVMGVKNPSPRKLKKKSEITTRTSVISTHKSVILTLKCVIATRSNTQSVISTRRV
jgi:hypothetical protein